MGDLGQNMYHNHVKTGYNSLGYSFGIFFWRIKNPPVPSDFILPLIMQFSKILERICTLLEKSVRKFRKIS